MICFVMIFYIVPTGPPQNFNVTAINYTTVYLSWDRPLPEEENGILIMYTITYNGSREEKQSVSNILLCAVFM